MLSKHGGISSIKTVRNYYRTNFHFQYNHIFQGSN